MKYYKLEKIRVLLFLTKKEKVCLIVLLEIHNSNILKSNNKGTKILSGSNVYKEYKFNSNLFFYIGIKKHRPNERIQRVYPNQVCL